MQSMTGYGKGVAAEDGRSLTVELKSVNHRYLDLGMRLPRAISFLEDPLRRVLSENLSRGHVDVFVNYVNSRSDSKRVTINQTLLTEYLSAAREANAKLGLSDDLTLSEMLRLPDVTEISEADEDQPALIRLCQSACQSAVDALNAMRNAEGERLRTDLTMRMDLVEQLTARIAERAPLVVEEYRAKLNERIAQILTTDQIDPARLATEVALFADRASIDEEIVRLRSHAAEIRKLFAASEPVGRKLDFVVQELNREFNTIGSKANDGELTKLVLSGKAEIEKIREQVQNIE